MDIENSPTLPYATVPVSRLWTIPPRTAYLMIATMAVVLTASGQVLSFGLGFRWEGRQNANPSFIFTRLDLCCMVLWLISGFGMLLIPFFTRRLPRVIALVSLTTCIFVITPLQCAFRAGPLERYETGFLQWTTGHVNPAAIGAWHATLPPVTAPTALQANTWPAAVALLNPSNVTQYPGGILLEWGRVGAWGNSRRVFISANGGVLPPTNNDNILFNWNRLGPTFHAAYQTTD